MITKDDFERARQAYQLLEQLYYTRPSELSRSKVVMSSSAWYDEDAKLNALLQPWINHLQAGYFCGYIRTCGGIEMTKKLSERVQGGEFDLCVDGQSCMDATDVDTNAIANEIESLERQRDALLNAVKNVIDADAEGHMIPNWLVESARAAIESVEGEK